MGGSCLGYPVHLSEFQVDFPPLFVPESEEIEDFVTIGAIGELYTPTLIPRLIKVEFQNF